ncbi:MAG: hypothetical protein EXX96DRAFT_605344 [Benjaminiella poitrasii]|nr:MAG: hypothetical protein EXX96DRAFT_605344 [Benjaminiella poitrasii]
MEAFAPLPADLFADSSAILEEDPSNYFSLSQFDLELQQQAQAALLQQDTWQDFDKYLPIDNQLFSSITNNRNEQAQPIFMNNNNNNNNNNDNNSTLLYDPVADLLSPQQQQQQQQQQSKVVYDNNLAINSNWEDTKNNVKQEYASPESLPYSPPQNNNMQANLSLSPPPSQQQDMPLFHSSSKNSNLTTPSLDFMNWNNNPLSNTTPIDTNPATITAAKTTQGKVPIQRLKSNNTINSASNTTVNSGSNNGGRQHKKTAHNAIERRYRNNINDRIAELKNAVPALLHAKVKDNRTTGKRSHKGGDDDDDDGEDSEEYLDGVAVATKLNKATILRKATEYITHLKKTGDDMRRENQTLQHILSQLPGGSDILQRYYLQKQQREQELQKQRILERQLQKQQEQQRKAANRKRARYNNEQQQEVSDEYESSSSSPGSMDPVTPPAMTNRVFMALFMCITFFSTSPLTSGPSSSEQYQNHHHTSRATTSSNNPVSNSINYANASPESFMGSLFSFDNRWSALRTIVFIICIVQLLFPYVKYMIFGSAFKLKRVNRTKRVSVPRKELANNTVTPGELKSRQVHNILEQSISHQEGDYVPESILTTILPLCKEATRIFSHHILGYDIMYGENDDKSPEEEWGQVCKWIKLNETKCVGGASSNSRLSMLYSCFRMINLVDTFDEECHDHANQTRARAYATAAIMTFLIIPKQRIAERVSNYFWSLAIHHSKDLSESNEEVDGSSYDEESSVWMQSLAWIDPEQDIDSIEDIPKTHAWEETMKIVRNQILLSSSSSSSNDISNTLPLTISYTAPVIVPVAILSTLHLLDNLRIQFDRLMSTMASRSEHSNSYDESLETAFFDIMLLTEPANNSTAEYEDANTISDQQRLAHWLAAVGAIVEAIWKNNTEQAEKWLPTLLQRVPRSMTCRASTVSQKSILNQLDELIKKAMIHILVGAVFLKSDDTEKQKQGLIELENAQVLRSAIRKLQSKVARAAAATNEQQEGYESSDLESTVMVLAEFVVSYIGLESWIDSMKLITSAEKEILIEESVSEITLNLRRMIRLPSLEAVSGNQTIVDRLSRLGRFIANQPGDADSACDLSDEDCNSETATLLADENLDSHQLLVKKSDKAQSILRGLA